MSLLFPKINDLSFEQKMAVNLEHEKNSLVLGAPGTGKTIVAMHRINSLYEKGMRDLLLIVYNRPLMEYLRTVQKELKWENRFEIYTVHEWLNTKIYSGYDGQREKNINEPVPKGIISTTTPHLIGNTFAIDWDAINNDFKDRERIYSHIVVDEGQDEPLGFYYFIKKVARRVTIFADPNQALDENPVKVSDILSIINKNSYFVLTLNYRNSKKVADFTRRYCVDKSVFAESYRDGEDSEVVKCKNDKEEILKSILEIVKKCDSDKEIGIIVPSSRDIANDNTDFVKGLNNDVYDYLLSNLSNNYDVTIYQNKETGAVERKNVDFEKKSIKIFTYHTVKGLDFDVVILVDVLSMSVNDYFDSRLNVNVMNKLYVSATRSKDKLYIIPICDEADTYIDNDEGIDYSKFPSIQGMSSLDCYNKSKECYKNKRYDESMYYLHYAISIVGLDDNQEVLIDAMRKMAFLCERFNKNDFAIGIISNYAERSKVYDDPKLIYFYQSCLLNSYNGVYSYSNPEKFFTKLIMIDNKVDRNLLLEKYYNKYMQDCKNAEQIPDERFTIQYISKYNLHECKAWKSFREKAHIIAQNEKEKQEELERREREDSELWKTISNMTGNELLQGNKILVYAGARESVFHSKFNIIIDKYGYIEDNFVLYIDYGKMTNQSVSINNIVAVILGPHPHNTRDNSWIFKVEIGAPGYPKCFRLDYHSGMNSESFESILDDVTFYLKTNLYDERKVFE